MGMRLKMNLLLMVALSVVLLVSCSSTQVVNVWMDEGYKGKMIGKTMVIGVTPKEQMRKTFEDTFSRKLKERNVDAISSYTVLPQGSLPDKETVVAKLKQIGADSVLVTKLVDRKTVRTYVPGQTYVAPTGPYSNFYGYYSMSYSYVHTPGYAINDDVALIETNLYDVASEKLIWTAQSEVWTSDATTYELLQSYVGQMVSKLASSGLIK